MSLVYKDEFSVDDAYLLVKKALTLAKPKWGLIEDERDFEAIFISKLDMIVKSRVNLSSELKFSVTDLTKMKVLLFADVICGVCLTISEKNYMFSDNTVRCGYAAIHFLCIQNTKGREITQRISDIIKKEKYILN